MTTPTLLTPYGYSASTCGYCSPSGSRSTQATSKKYGMKAPQMSCQFYQDLIDRGWRRSGDYIYRPDMERTCCPQYTIRLDAVDFKVGKKHRQVVNRLNRFLGEGYKPGDSSTSTAASESAEVVLTKKNGDGKDKGKGKGKSEGKGKVGGEWDLETELRRYEEGYGEEAVHRYTTELVPAKATKETFELYKKYQIAVHNDKEDDVSMRGFSRFLCDSPLIGGTIPYAKGAETSRLPEKYGSYHLLYRVDGKLIGISVIDILPRCVSTVYFIWDPEYAWASLGKVSAMREIILARDLYRAGLENLRWVYMGYWIPDCGKMVYKSEYSPSYLLDPNTFNFHLLDSKLDSFLKAHPAGYFPFAEIMSGALDATPPKNPDSRPKTGDGDGDEDMSDVEELDDFPKGFIPGFRDPRSFTTEEIERLLVLMKGRGMRAGSRLVAVEDLSFGDTALAHLQIRELVAAVGYELMARGNAGLEGVKDKGLLFFG